jgi:hypothetical protein
LTKEEYNQYECGCGAPSEVSHCPLIAKKPNALGLEELDYNVINRIGSIANAATGMKKVAVDFAQLQHGNYIVQVFGFAEQLGQAFGI